jgi:SAM-dependent MidA family methyltransferase
MKISHFISQSLFNDDYGYYRTKNPIGKNSDFITGPEISQVFGELLAAYLLNVAAIVPGKIALVEMGAGKGTLFKDLLITITKLAKKNLSGLFATTSAAAAVNFLKKTTFHIIEINPVLRQIQQKNLANFIINWHENFSCFLDYIAPCADQLKRTLNIDHQHEQDLKIAKGQKKEILAAERREIFFISNELFDCFPVDQFVLTEIGWRERLIDVAGKFILAEFNKEIHDFVAREIAALAPIGAVFEYSAEARNFMVQLCQALKQQGGIAINIDYGYVKNEFANTLQAVKNHRKCNIFETPGETDISALVDFAALKKIAQNFGLNSSLVSQRDFLTELGIKERQKTLLAKKSPACQEKINLAISRLIDLNQMGELFKCLIVWK